MIHTIATNIDPSETYASTPLAGTRVVIKNSLLRMFFAWQTHRALRRAEADLQRLDDRMLKDIGLSRSEISSVLRDLSRERDREFERPITRPY